MVAAFLPALHQPLPKALIIDCDPGVDDAIALFLAFATDLPILGITTVAGNVPLPLTYRNARNLCALAGRLALPVFAGCPRPMMRSLATAEDIHGATGLQGADLPESTAAKPSQHAVDFLIQQLLTASDPIAIAALGPLTNLAVALIQCPQIAENIDQLVIMGGAMGQGNITPSAEFNIYVDPHAAQVVLSAGIPTTLITLDTTHQVLTTPARLAAIRALNNPVSIAAAGMLSFYGQNDLHRYGLAGGPLHDPCVIAYLLAPELFTARPVNIAVETAGEHTIGRTVVDWYGDRPSAAVQVIETVDADSVYALLIEALGRFSV
ncbi:MAG: purine nucleosidase IunH [Phormidesmis priestleyi Ana]|uniref:Purine nucleosidase IunH n=1 Tax=Phormidesmis priestleyi Ana TaxID=1666911 RepID=A0A0P7YYS0_9CYAN|nr:MAG: purine nucleosidase IunH [Phormidesmis priestleyi Ana]